MDEFVVVCLDGVPLYSKTREEMHEASANRVAESPGAEVVLAIAEVRNGNRKRKSLVSEPEKVSADRMKVKTIQQRPKELLARLSVRGFLGLVRYYRKLIPDWKEAHPLLLLLKENSGRIWRSRHTRAARELEGAHQRRQATRRPG